MKKIFGTDGARGIANVEITCELAVKIGKALTSILPPKEKNTKHTLLIGKDTRVSCDMLESATAAGICSEGANVILLGVIPTPAVSFLVQKYGASAGIMISASHNSFEFNGIKIFDGNGMKLPDEKEEEIENILEKSQISNNIKNEKVGKIFKNKTASDDYISQIKNTVNENFKGLKVAVDCSNGSASVTAKKLFNQLGCECKFISCNPNGININEKCGSTNIENLIKTVENGNFDAGIAFDGDADRCLMVDEAGETLDGDALIAICAKKLKEQGELNGNTVVGTIVSNMGLINFCHENNINFIETNVGDRYILEELSKNNYSLGGEQSGHIILKKYANSGDGQLTAIQILNIMKAENKPLSYIKNIMKSYPQVSLTATISRENRGILEKNENLKNYIEKLKSETKNEGKIVVRESGTEPKIRILAEFLDKYKAKSIAENIKNEIEKAIL